jgi:hypothetical protein
MTIPEYTETSTAASGVPIRVEDPATIAKLRLLVQP